MNVILTGGPCASLTSSRLEIESAIGGAGSSVVLGWRCDLAIGYFFGLYPERVETCFTKNIARLVRAIKLDEVILKQLIWACDFVIHVVGKVNCSWVSMGVNSLPLLCKSEGTFFRGTHDGFLLNRLKHFFRFPEYFRSLEMHSKRRYRICICSVIPGELDSFRNYRGFSIIFSKTLHAF